jgi:transcriptional regulator with XRE-family HTH domain
VAKRGKASVGSELKPPPLTWLSRYRREAAVEQGELAAATGISQRTLQRLESGETDNPPLRYLISCAMALGLDDWHLLLEDEWLRPLGNKAPRRAKSSTHLQRRS